MFICICVLFAHNVSVNASTLSLIWSPGFCKTNDCNPNYVHATEFTVHGLWLDKCPHIRQHGHPHVDQLLSHRMIADLHIHWPSSFGHDVVFWNHEWETHGTCLGTLHKSTSSVGAQANEYFKLALDIYHTVPIASWLRSSHIVPSNTVSYTYNQIETAIRNHTNHGVHLLCSRYQGRVYLYQLELVLKFDQNISSHTFDEPSYTRHGLCPYTDIFIAL
jgi:ribonuclease T2